MRVAVFSTQPYDRRFLLASNAAALNPDSISAAAAASAEGEEQAIGRHELVFFKPQLNLQTAPLARGFEAVCVFVNDILDAPVLEQLASGGIKLVALRCAGFNNVDLSKAAELGITVVRVPAYSPYAVAEHAVALMMTLNRRTHRAYNRVREGNFSLEGLLGFDMHNKVVGVVGTGRIGTIVARILTGFGCKILGYDTYQSDEFLSLGGEYVSLEELFRRSDIITLHCPLMPQTRHLINAEALRLMKRGVMIVNTSRGELIDTLATIRSLKEGHIGFLGLDVYEEEADLFFHDLSGLVIQDDIFARLLTFPNVLITGHQGFFTHNALQNIASTTIANISSEEEGVPCDHRVLPPKGKV